MSRFPPEIQLDWTDSHIPVSMQYNDIYFSKQDGLKEARYVFLGACDLPEAWVGQDRFSIGELGFGTGLNFLALWDMWRKYRPAPDAQLHFLTFEATPLTSKQARRAHKQWPELDELSDKLIQNWPDRAYGIRRIWFEEDGLCLTLCIGLAERMLPQITGQINAWFLDGFTPARNSELWSEIVFAELARLSIPGTKIASYSAAGQVVRNLTASGFEMKKYDGFGKKRHRLQGVYTNESRAQIYHPSIVSPPSKPPRSIAIIGAGIVGAACARAFAMRGVRVQLYEAGAQPASGASGNPLALVMPRIDAEDNPTSRWLLDAYLYARQIYQKAGEPKAYSMDTHQFISDIRSRIRFGKILADAPLGEEDLQSLSDDSELLGLSHKHAIVIRPHEIIRHWLDRAYSGRINIQYNARIDDWRALAENVDLVILCNGHEISKFTETNWLPVKGRWGQLEYMHNKLDEPDFARVSGQYAIKLGEELLFGASFEAPEKVDGTASKVARQSNIEALERLAPEIEKHIRTGDLISYTGIRATMPDRLPIMGMAVDPVLFQAQNPKLNHGIHPVAPAPGIPRLALIGGVGARGMMFAPFLSETFAALSFGEPVPMTLDALACLSPARFLIRQIQRAPAKPRS